MKLERIDPNSESYNLEMKKRKQSFGNAGSDWVCEKCNHSIHSFIYNFEYHVPEVCPECKEGSMTEDETKRKRPDVFNFIDGSRQKNWEQGLSPMQQASVLLDEADPY